MWYQSKSLPSRYCWLFMGDRDRDVAAPITRADLEAQNVRIHNLANQFVDIHELLLQAVDENNRREDR